MWLQTLLDLFNDTQLGAVLFFFFCCFFFFCFSASAVVVKHDSGDLTPENNCADILLLRENPSKAFVLVRASAFVCLSL